MKKIVLILCLCFNLLFLSSCTIDVKILGNDTSLDENLLVPAGKKIDLNDFDIQNKEYRNFIEKLELFSAKLTVEIYKTSDKNKNLCISPISIYMALAMTIGSSNDSAKEELLDAIGVTEEEVLEFTKYLYSFLNQEYYDYDEDISGKKLTSISNLNNAIWIDNNITLKENGLEKLANSFNADSYYAPFRNVDENEKANKLLSSYISDKTRGLINPELKLSTDTLFALVNTLYLKDFWSGKELDFTEEEYDFKTSSGEIIKKALMKSTYTVGVVYETEAYTHYYAITGHGYKLKFIVPKDGYTLEQIFNENNIVNINRITDYNGVNKSENIQYNTRVIFPSFEASYEDDIVPILKSQFNVKTIFSKGVHMNQLTDFELFCSKIFHYAKLKVDQKGIEGAAATIVAFEDESVSELQDVLLDFVIDKSFGYILTDRYDTILFSGVVNTI